MDYNILIDLNNVIGFDDEQNRVEMDDVRKLVTSLDMTLNSWKSNEQIYEEFHEYIRELPVVKDGMHSLESVASYAENRLFFFALNWIWYWGSVPTKGDYGVYTSWVDERNRASTDRCKSIVSDDDYLKMLRFYASEIDYQDSPPDEVMERFYYEFCKLANTKMHRTIVQKATGFMLYAISKSKDSNAQKLCKKLSEKYGNYFRFPLV